METLLAAKEWNKVFHKDRQKYRIKVRAELVHRDGNSWSDQNR